MQDQSCAAETAREYQAKVDMCLARVERVSDRIRTQDWYHDLSEQESDEETEQMLEKRTAAEHSRATRYSMSSCGND